MHLLTEESAQRLPARIRRSIFRDCDGEYDRVTMDEDGGWTVWNSAAQALRRCPQGAELTPAASPAPTPIHAAKPATEATPPKHSPTPKVMPSRRERSPEASALQAVFGTLAPQPRPVLTVVEPEPEPEPQPEPDEPTILLSDGAQWTADPQNTDWASVDMDRTVVALRDKLADGLPYDIPFCYYAEVLAMAGMDFGIVEGALRHPQRVTIQPETKTKGYPVLAFWRGDIVTILGMKTPTKPMIIAAYADSKMMADRHSVNNGSSTGGGGARKTQGLPKNCRAMVKAIRGLGITCDPGARDTAYEVMYQGQSLGKISIGDATPRATVEADYQRIVRRKQAVDRRAS